MDKNIIYNADCLDPVEGMARLPDNSVDVCITDPPYGATACKWDTVIPFDKMWEQLHRVVKDNGAIVLFGSEPFSSALRMSNIKNYKYDWVWEKDKPSNFALSKKQPMKYHENISVFNKHRYFPVMWFSGTSVNKSAKYGRTETEVTGGGLLNNKQAGGNMLRYPKSIYKCNVVNNQTKEKAKHPTQKPVKLIEYLIKTYTQENETVLDFTMGSGTTAIACMRTGRNYIGWEKDSDYYKIIQDRIQKEIECFSLFNK